MTLLFLALVVAVVSRTVTQEAVFAELREWAKNKMAHPPRITFFAHPFIEFKVLRPVTLTIPAKVFYPLTCQYCFSHWVAFALALVTRYRVAFSGLTGLTLTVFVLVGLANAFLIVYEKRTVEIRIGRQTLEQGDLVLVSMRQQQEIATHNLEAFREQVAQVAVHGAKDKTVAAMLAAARN